MESLTIEQLEDRLRDLINANKLENKSHSEKNSYFIVGNEETTFPKETFLASDIIFPEEKPIPLLVLKGILIRIFRSEN